MEKMKISESEISNSGEKAGLSTQNNEINSSDDASNISNPNSLDESDSANVSSMNRFKMPLKVAPRNIQLVQASSTSTESFKKPILVGPRKPKKGTIPSNLKPSSSDSKDNETTSDTQVSHIDSSIEPCPVSTSKSETIVNNDPEVVSSSQPRASKVSASQGTISFPYQEPQWKGIPEDKYSLEELKAGVIEKEIDLCGRSFTIIGRHDTCHITMAHPTVSRFHAVVQYRESRLGIYDKGFYLYDLGSTHGTFLNKHRIKPQTYVRIQVGHMIKLGCSTRFLILQGPDDDQEAESELTVTELKEKRQQELAERKQKEEEAERLKKEMEEKVKLEMEQRGIDWGMGEDADEETDLSENPYAITTNEELYADDPKKELRKWYEREGEELRFEVEQAERGKIVCKVTLPLDTDQGGDVVIESTGRSKKEATTTCALEACRHIDKLGLFRQSNQESKKRQVRNWEENDFYDSDEDSFFDRTGEVEQKRQKRMRKAGKIQDTVQTYESLVASHEEVLKTLAEAEERLARMTSLTNSNVQKDEEGVDELDKYMKSLKQSIPSKMEIKACKTKIANLKEEEARLVQLINIAKPASIPNLKPLERVLVKSTPPLTSPKDSAAVSGGPKEADDSKNLSDGRPKERSYEEKAACVEDRKEEGPPEPPVKKERVIGPFLPSSVDLQSEEKKQKKSRSRNKQKPPKVVAADFVDDYNNLSWKPPEGQTGDGRTSLNDKFGY